VSLTTLPGGVAWWPDALVWTNNFGIAGGTYLIDATGEIAAMVIQCPKAGTLDRFDFHVATVTNSPDNGLRASFQGVDLATGLPDGTILGATNSAFVTYAHTVTTGWKSTNFGETVTVTAGQLISLVVDIPSFTASDSIAMSHLSMNLASGYSYGVTATTTKQSNNMLACALHYTDGYAYVSPVVVGVNATTNTSSYHVDTVTADEWGMAFQVPVPCALSGATINLAVAAGANWELLVYDSSDTVLATVTLDGDVSGGTSILRRIVSLSSALTLTPNVTYRVTARPTTTNALIMSYAAFASLDLMDAVSGGRVCYMTSRLNQGGAWTDYNSGTFRRPFISLGLSAFSDSEYAGGVFGG